MARKVVRKKPPALAGRVEIQTNPDLLRVRFKMGEGAGEWITVEIFKGDTSRLLIRAGQMLNIQPDMANTLTIRCNGKDFR